jgi:hypothetical protein
VAFSFCGGEEMFGWLKRKAHEPADMSKYPPGQVVRVVGGVPIDPPAPPKFDPHVQVREWDQAFIGNMRISNVQRSQTSLYHKWRFVKRERAITFTGTVAEFREYLAEWR